MEQFIFEISNIAVVVLIFIILDVLSGICAAAVQGKLCSSEMRKGMWAKLAELMLMILGGVVQYSGELAGFDVTYTSVVFNVVSIYIIGMEFISIIENICKMNPNLCPDKLLAMFGKQNKESDNDAD